MSADGVGSAADEAARLLTAAEQWARRRAAALDDGHLATGSVECSVCPVCQAIGALRQVRPEAVAHLLDAVGSLVAALRAAVPAPPTAATPTGGMQRIDLDDPEVPWP